MVFGTVENGENRHIELMLDEMGCSVFAREPEPDCHFSGRKNNLFHNRDENMSSPLHIISTQICKMGIILALETVESKSREILAVQELLKNGY